MVELLAAVTIVAVVTLIAIKGVSGMIERAKTERTVQQQKALIIAAESYIQANSQLKPKTIGESRFINVIDLKKSNYLKADIVNSEGESCMDESKVRVYKLSKMEYSYYPYIYCGDEKAPDSIDPPTPYISTYFTDASGKKYPSSHVFNDVSKARLAIVLKGEETEDIAIDGYSYAIDSVDSTGRRTVFDSGSLSANRKSELLIYVDLKDYIDVSDKTEFYISIFVRNVHGGEFTFEGSLDVTGNGSGVYEDKSAPACADIQNQAAEGEWINKYSAVKERTITVLCEDGDGSGCVRDTFSRTWPNKTQKSAEYAYIRVSDNRGNKTPNRDDFQSLSCNPGSMCCVRVNVDTVSPTIQLLKAQRYNGSKLTGQNVLSNNVIEANNDNESVVINTTDINGSDTSVSEEGWLNLKNFSYGIGFVFTVSDDIGLDNWKWETNEAEIWTTNDDGLGTLLLDNKIHEGAFHQFKTDERITSSSQFEIYFKGNGRRKGVLTVRDIAGNETKYVFNINIDTREVEINTQLISCDDDECTPNCTNPDDCPNPPTFANSGLKLNKYLEPSNSNVGEPYIPGTWSNLSIIASPADFVVDYIEQNPGTTFKYIVYKENSGVAGHSAGTAIIDGPHTSRNDKYYFDNSVSPDSNGKNRIALAVCTIGGNCAQTENYNVYIDTIAPECNLESLTSDGIDYDGSYWLKKGKNAIVTAYCSEKTDGNYTKSGCENSSQWPSQFSFTYDFDALSYIAGAKGIDTNGNNHGAVRDNAGNVTECPANKTIMIDHTDPECTIEAKLNNSTTYNGTTWGKKGDKITVTGTCSDRGGSGTGSGCMIYSGNKPTFDGRKTTASYVYQNQDYNSKYAGPYGLSTTARVTDGAGNIVTCPNTTVKLDVNPPKCGTRTGAAANQNTFSNASTITVKQKCTDETSGCDYAKAQSTGCNIPSTGVTKTCTCNSTDGCSRSYTSDIAGDFIYLYDVAGNTKKCEYYVNRDTVSPDCGDADKPEPTELALERTRTMTCKVGSGIVKSPCSQTTFSKTWKVSVDGAVDDSYIPISDTAGNTKNCPVKVMIGEPEEEEGTPTCYDFKNRDVEMFGVGMNRKTGTYQGHVIQNYKLQNANDYNLARPAATVLSNVFGSGYNGCYSGDGGKTHPAPCVPTYGYPRVCVGDLCGIFKGMTAIQIREDARFKALNCSDRPAKYWCSCHSSNIYIDWFNAGYTYYHYNES